MSIQTVHNLATAPRALRINLLEEPLCLRPGTLCISWQPGEGTIRQTACRVVVAAGAVGVADECYIYDSGWVETDVSTAYTPVGLAEAVVPGRLYYLQVAVRNEQGKDSPLSAPLAFSVDTERGDMEGIWAPAATVEEELPDFAFLRRPLTLSDENAALDCLLLTVTATSPEPSRQFVYDIYINGTEVGLGPCRLGKTPHKQECLYHQTYDVTSLLKAGQNALAAFCYATVEHGFYCSLVGYDADGMPHVLTDSSRDYAAWRALSADAVFAKNNFIGTSYFKAHAANMRASLYPFGFAEADFVEDDRWTAPTLTGDIRHGRLLLSGEYPTMKHYESTAPVTVTPSAAGGQLIDLGAEIIGGIRLVLDNPTDAPVSVVLEYGEQTVPDGAGGRTVKFPMNTGNRYRETWELRPGRQTLESPSLIAFRYVRVAGLPVPLTPADVCGLEIRKAFDATAGNLETDHDLLAAIYRLTAHTVKVTSQDIYVDSQSRERGAYEGDLLINMLAAYAHEDCYAPARLSTEYLLGRRTWPADYLLCIIYAAHADYMATGDTRLLRAWYDTLCANLFERYLDETGLIHAPTLVGANGNAILVDWPPSERDGYDMDAPYNTVLNAMQARAWSEMVDIATAIGRLDDAERFRQRAEALKATMIEKLYDPADGRFCDGLLADGTPSSHKAQHATAYALNAGIYTDAAMADRMAGTIAADGCLRASVYASFFLLDGLYRSGHGDVANRLMLDPDTSDGARTWAYMIERVGATVTTEAWNETNKPNMTLSHPWGAAPASMLMTGICGITPTTPGYATMDIRPAIDGIGQANVTLPTIRGAVRMSWHRGSSACDLTVTLPTNTEATVYLPGGRAETVGAGTHHFRFD